jgi:hypothetical protein
MANFPVDPLPFVPPGIEIEDGEPHRVPRAVVHLAGNPVYAHEEYVLEVDTQQLLNADDINHFMHQVTEYIHDTFHIPIRSSYRHPFGIGLNQLDTTFHKDLLFAANPHDIDGIEVNFISQDRALNRRNWDYNRYGWIMLLGYPPDYRDLVHIDQAVSSFAKLVTWHNNGRSLGYVLVKCLYNDAQSVPRSLVLRQGERNGRGWCWTIPVYVLNWDHLDVHVPDVDDIPPGGNPHPPAMDDIFQAEHLPEQVLDDGQLLHNLQAQVGQAE